jgi:hypothetical protein
MFQWVIGLRTVFALAVALAVKTPVPKQVDGMLFYRLHDGEFEAWAPGPTTSLLVHILSGVQSLDWSANDVDQIVRELIPLGAPKAELRRVCDELARHGYAGASDLLALL